MPRKKPGRTSQLEGRSLAEQRQSFPPAVEASGLRKDVEYHPLPSRLPVTGEARPPSSWRIQLINGDGRILGLDLYSDALLGRGVYIRERPGVDLSEWGADEMGVSREHALLRLTPDRLYLLDIGSTNGTFLNSEKIMPGILREIADGDVIVLGKLVMMIRVIQSPQGELPAASLNHPANTKEVSGTRSR